MARISVGRAVLIGLVVCCFYYFLVYDAGINQTAAISQSNQKIHELQTKLQDYQQKLDAAAVFKKTAAEVGSTISRLLTLIPEQFNMSDLMRIVSNEAKVAGSSMTTLEPKTTQISPTAKEFEELTVSVELQGSFLQHMIFLSNLTKGNQILVIRKYEFNQMHEGKAEEAPVVKMVAEIVAYRYRGAEAAGKAPGK
ncbi:MAG: type 4a pilus biogenesis protein PilO [Pseudobdellovibrionaceae bacterium]